MINQNNAPTLLGMAAIVVTLGIGTCSTNTRIDDGFANVNRRMDDGFDNVNRRIDDTNRRIDNVESGVGEIRTMLFEILKDRTPAN